MVKVARVIGTKYNDNLTGTNWGDAMFGLAGNDTIKGGGGGDYLMGGLGVDRIFGGAGDDRMNLTAGNTAYSHTNTAAELLDGGTGRDNAHIDASGSTVDGRPTDSVFIGYQGEGKHAVTIGSDAGLGNAQLATAINVESFVVKDSGPALSYIGNIGGGGGPTLNITGSNKGDYFTGGGETTIASLLGGDDVAIISGGGDTFTLGSGGDTVKFSALYNGDISGKVMDFNPEEDVLELQGWTPETLAVTEDAGGTWLTGGEDVLYLVGVTDYDPFIA